MNGIISFKEVESKILVICGQQVLVDRDVAELYGVETKRVNEAVSNNPDKFPNGYVLTVTQEEWKSLRSKFSTLDKVGRGRHTKYPPRVFTERGLYMLATILKSPYATQTTLAIIETFAKIRELSGVIRELPEAQEDSRQKTLMKKSGELLAEILDDNALEVSGDETTIELNLALMKVKHTIKRKKK